MGYCSKCGNEIQNGQKFCRNCGQAVNAVNGQQVNANEDSNLQASNLGAGASANNSVLNAPVATPNATSLNVATPKERKKISKKALTGIISSALIIILCLSAYFIGASMNSKEKVAAKITKAIEDNDAKKLAKYVVSSDDKLEINEESLTPLVQYLKDNSKTKQALIGMIEGQAKLDDKSGKVNIEDLSNYQQAADLFLDMLSGNHSLANMFTLKKQGKTMLVYDKYVLELNPVYLEITTNYKDSKIYLNDTLVATANEDNFTAKIGPYVPGKYTIKVSLDGEHAKAEKKDEVDLVAYTSVSDKGKNIFARHINLDIAKVAISSNYKEAKLIVNGSDTGMTIKDIDEYGPILIDGSVTFQAKMDFPWGSVTSEEVPVKGRWIELKLDVIDDKMKEETIEIVTAYLKSVNEAFTTLDSSKFVNVTEEKRKVQVEKIDTLIKNNQKYVGGIKKVYFDLDSFELDISDDTYELTLKDSSVTDSAYYDAGESAPETEEKSDNSLYTLVYDKESKTWLIDDVRDTYYFNDNNTKEVIISE